MGVFTRRALGGIIGSSVVGILAGCLSETSETGEEENTIEFTIETVNASDREDIEPDTEFSEEDLIKVDRICLYAEEYGFHQCFSSIERATFDIPESPGMYHFEVFDCEHGSIRSSIWVSETPGTTQIKLDGTHFRGDWDHQDANNTNGGDWDHQDANNTQDGFGNDTADEGTSRDGFGDPDYGDEIC